MTLVEILTGPMEKRSNAEARTGKPMNAAQVRCIIATMERYTKSRAARESMANHAVKRANCDDEGRALWQAYAAPFRSK